MTENQILEIIHQILLGLSFMHKYGFFIEIWTGKFIIIKLTNKNSWFWFSKKN